MLPLNNMKEKSKINLIRQKNPAGFTLVELLIVISIIGILSTLVMSNFVGIRQRARDGQRKSDIVQIQSALEFYRSDVGSYPAPPLPACGTSLTGGSPVTTYMKKVPCDPLTNSLYTYSVVGNTYTLRVCLENVNDGQKDASNNNTNPPGCNGTSNWSYTRTNP